MSDVLHLSDLHFGPPFLADRAEAVRSLARRLEPDVVVVSGDLTQRARKSQFRDAAEYLESLPAPVVVTPGNHDVPLYRIHERIFSPYRHYRRYISRELNTVTRLEGMTIVALNSSRVLSVTNGRLDEGQLAFAEEAFEGSPGGDLRVVVTHHHLAPTPDFAEDRVMPRARRALERFRGLRVHLILAGHMHRAYIGDSLDFFPGEDREEGIVIVQCGTTTSARGRGRERFNNSLNYIRADREEIYVSHYLWRDAREGFSPHSRHRFGTPPHIWLEPEHAVEGAQEVRTRSEEAG